MTDWIKEMVDEYGITTDINEPSTPWRTVPSENVDNVRGVIMLMLGDRVSVKDEDRAGELKQTTNMLRGGQYILMSTGGSLRASRWHLHTQRLRDLDNKR